MDKDKLAIFIIEGNETIENALGKIEDNKSQTLIVVDNELRVLGTITDGDIRKALIAKRTLFAPVYDVMNTHCHSVLLEKIEDAKKIFTKHYYINLIPVINDQGILQDIVHREN